MTATSLSEKDKAALAKLLADEDSKAIQLLEESFRAKGSQGMPLLREIIDGNTGLTRQNAERILRAIQHDQAREAFLKFCVHGTDLEAGAFLLAKTRYPSFSESRYTTQLDAMAQKLKSAVVIEDPRFTIEAINQHLFVELGFRGNSGKYYDPDNSFINQVLDRRTGIPITLCAVYLFVSRRLRLPIVGVGTPGHFILKWGTGTETEDDDLFIDPFNQGRILTTADCEDFLKRTGHESSKDILAPVNSRQILARMCNNLVAIYRQMEEQQLASEYETYANELARP